MKPKSTRKKPSKLNTKEDLAKLKGKPSKYKKGPRQNTTNNSSLPVKKIPSVHSVPVLEAGQDPKLVWKHLVQEKHRNGVLQMEIERLRKSLEVSKKSVQEMTTELECKNKVINKLIENQTRIESTSSGGIIDDEIDIDNLLHANLGDMAIGNLLNFTDSAFHEDLDKLDITKIETEPTLLTLSPASLTLATNTSYIVDESQFPNREASMDEKAPGTNNIVGKILDQEKSFPFPISAPNSCLWYSCHLCDKQFTCKSILRAHVTWHCQTSAWQCSDCGYKLTNLTQFIKHIKSVHRVDNITSANKLLTQCTEEIQYVIE